MKREALKEDEPKLAKAAGKSLVVLLHNGKIYTLDSVCIHEVGPLEEGEVSGDGILCPWHAGRYNAMTGKVDEETLWVIDLQAYRITEEGGELFLEA
ncbi:MAG: Rieske (2Fe-2S) protein [Candidatus Micrarchaeia archaeon]